MKEAITNSYYKKGDKVLNMNYAAVDRGLESLVKVDVPEEWKSLPNESCDNNDADLPRYIRDILIPVNRQKGDKIPVSKFLPIADGVTEVETSKYEKRGIAVSVPEWIAENCIGCNQCSLVCPHATIRPFLLNSDEDSKAPDGLETKNVHGKGMEGYTFIVKVVSIDWMGCLR